MQVNYLHVINYIFVLLTKAYANLNLECKEHPRTLWSIPSGLIFKKKKILRTNPMLPELEKQSRNQTQALGMLVP